MRASLSSEVRGLDLFLTALLALTRVDVKDLTLKEPIYLVDAIEGTNRT